MKLLPKTDQHLILELTELETQLLHLTLSAYPMSQEPWSIPPSAAKDPKGPRPTDASDADLLRTALSEEKSAYRDRLEAFLKGPALKPRKGGGCRLTLPLEDIDWFLQVVNELRVGSWYRLGCPEEHQEDALQKHPERFEDILRMDFSGMLLDGILRACQPASE